MFISIENLPMRQVINMSELNTPRFTNRKTILFLTEEIHTMFHESVESIQSFFSSIETFTVIDNSYDVAVQAARRITFEDFSLVIGFGGGRVLDTAKYAAYISKCAYVCIPTILSNDGLVSPIAVLKTSQGKAKSFGAKPPDGVIISTQLMQKAPSNLIKAGICDTLSNFSALFDWRLDCITNNKRLDDFSYLLSDTALNIILYSQETDIYSPTFLKHLAESLILSGISMIIAGNSRPCSGSEHLFSHAIDQYYDLNIPHGIKVALGTICSCIFQNQDYGFLIDFIKKYDIELSPKKLGITSETFINSWILARSTRPDRYTILNKIELNEVYLRKLYNRLEGELS